MSMIDATNVCPICGDELHVTNFQVAEVWKDNKKQELFVCRHCVSKAQRKSKWQRPLDAFIASKEGGDD